MVSFGKYPQSRADRGGTTAIRSDAGRHSAQCPPTRGNVGASFRPIVHRCGAGRLCAIERFAADSATREVRHGMGQRAALPGDGGPLRRDRPPPGIDTVHHDGRHVRCRTDGAARAGQCTGGAIGSLGGAGRNDGLASSIGLGRVPLPGSPGRVRHRTRRRYASLRIRPTSTEPFLGQEAWLGYAGEAHAYIARGPIPIGQAGAARASAAGPWIPRPVACVVDDFRGIREAPKLPCPPTAIPRNAPSGRLVYGSEQTPRRWAGILMSGSTTGSRFEVRIDAPKRMSPKRGRQPTRRSTS